MANNNINDNEVRVIITADASPLKQEVDKAKLEISSISNVTKNITFNADTGNIKQAADLIKRSVSNGLQDGIDTSGNNVKGFSKEIRKSVSDGVSAGFSQGSIDGVKTAKKQMQNAIDSLDIDAITSSADKYVSTYNPFKGDDESSGKLKSLNEAKEDLKEYQRDIADTMKLLEETQAAMAKELTNNNIIRQQLSDVASQEEFYQGWEVALQGIIDKEIELNEKLEESNNKIEVLKQKEYGYSSRIDSYRSRASGASSYIEELGDNKDSLVTRLLKSASIKSLSNSGLSGFGRAAGVGIDALKGVVGSVSKLVPIIAGILAAIKVISMIVNSMKKTWEFIKKAAKAIAVTLKDMVVSATKFIGKLSVGTVKAFVTSVKAMGTALKGVISLMGKAISSFAKIFSMFSISYEEGITRMYEWATLNNGVFATSMNKITSCFHSIENSLAAIVTPLINTLSPIIDTITDKVLVLTNAIAKMMAQLSGAKSYTKVTKAATKFAEANDKAASSMEKVLLNIDELNKLNDNDTSEAANSFSEITMSLEDASAFDIGANFGQTLLDWLESINWTSIKQKASNVGKKFADILNGIFSTEGLGKKIGDSLAEVVNTAFKALDSFIDTIDIAQTAHLIADIVNGFFDTTEWLNHGETIGKYIQGAFDFVREFVATLDTADIGQSIAELFNGIFNKIDGDKVGLTLSDVVNSAFEILDNFIKEFDIVEMTTDISNLITSFFKNINFDQIDITLSDLVKSITTSINTFLNDEERVEAVGNAIYRLVKSAVDNSHDLITGIEWDKLAKNIGGYMSDAIEGLEPDKICDSMMTMFEAAFDLILNTPWAELAQFAMDLFNEILTAIPEELAKVSPSEIGNKIVEVLNIIIDDMNPTNIASAINSLIDWVGEVWEKVKDGVKWKDLVEKVTEAISKVDWAEAFKIVWEVWWKCWTFKEIFKGKVIWQLVQDLVEDIRTKCNDMIADILGVGEGIGNSIIQGIKDALVLVNPFTSIIDKANAVWRIIKNIKGELNNTAEEVDEEYSRSGGGDTRQFATGGVVYQPTAAIVGEYSGARSNPEIITPESKMREVFAEGNNALANVYILVGRQIIQAIENQDFSFSIGDDLIAKAAARGNNNYRRMTGTALI